MTTLKSLLEAVKDENLTQEQCEAYRDSLIHMHTSLQMEMATLEKAEAFYLMDSEEETEVGKKRAWRVTEKGQRLIELNRWTKAVIKEVDSLRSRVFSLI